MASSLLKPRRQHPNICTKNWEGGGGGEPQSIEELLASDDLYAILWDVLRPIAIALRLPTSHWEDVLQEVCLALVTSERPPFFMGERRSRQLRWWIRKIMRNKVVNALRQLRSGIEALADLAMEPAAPGEGETERKQHLWLREQFEEMAEDESLNARLLYRRFVEGKTNKELAAEYSKEQNNLTEKAVECRICRQIEELRQKALEAGLLVPTPENGSLKKKMGKNKKKARDFGTSSD